LFFSFLSVFLFVIFNGNRYPYRQWSEAVGSFYDASFTPARFGKEVNGALKVVYFIQTGKRACLFFLTGSVC
jgi:hypothetical protein